MLRMPPKKYWARRLRRLAPIRSVDRSGPVAGPDHLHTLHTPDNGEQTAGRSTEWQPNYGTTRSATVVFSPTSGDHGPPWRRYSSGSDAPPSWYAVAACCPSRRGPETDSPCLALPTVPPSGRCKSTLPQRERHGKKKMRLFCSEFILVVKRVRPQLLHAGPRRRLSFLPYNPRLLPGVGLTRSMHCR
jgi:hypothetical protein